MNTLKKKRSPYTKSDIKIIQELVEQYPDNLLYAFKLASKRVNHSEGSINVKYYIDLRKRPEFKAITCGSKVGFTQNVKNTNRKDGIFPLRTLNKPLWIVQTFLELTDKEKQLIVDILTIK